MINLNLKKSIFVPKMFPYIEDYSKRWEFWCGSAGSGKSYSIAQKIIIRCCREPIRVLVCRRYGTTLRNSCFALFKEILTKWQLLPHVGIKETDMSIQFPSGAKIIMIGLDSEEKLLSLANVSVVWVEEVYEVEKEKVEQLNLRMRGTAKNQQLILSWNPISRQSWLYDFTVANPPANSIFIHSTYKDNPFLPQEYIDALEEMAIRNPAKYRVYGKGEWGVNTDGLILTNYTIEEFDAMELAAKRFERRSGCDIGYIDPTAIVDTLYDKENHTIYVFNEFYKTGQQLDKIAAAMKDMGLTKTKIYVDSADARAVAYFKEQGLNAVPSIKGKDSVNIGVMFLQNNRIVIHPSCVNFINSIEQYSYIKSKQTGEYTDEIDHTHSHTMDAIRYAYCDIYTNRKLKTMNKLALGL